MKREDKRISLELAKQIDAEHKKLGLGVESELIYAYGQMSKAWCLFKYGTDYKNGKDRFGSDFYPAYDIAELGEMLEKYVDAEREDEEGIFMSYFYTALGWEVELNWETLNPYNDEKGYNDYRETGKPEVEARGKMYLWLLQK